MTLNFCVKLIDAVRCGSKNGHQNYMCLNKIGLRAQSMLTIEDSKININWENPYDHLINTRIFTLMMNKTII